MTIIKRADLGRPLTWDELDDNFQQVDDLTAAASAAVSSASASATAAASSAASSATSATDAANSAANAAAAIVSAVKSTITFTTGGTLNSNLDRISDGTYLYYWTGAYPVTVPADSTVDGTGGVNIGAWACDADLPLRSDLGSSDPALGVSLIYGALRVIPITAFMTQAEIYALNNKEVVNITNAVALAKSKGFDYAHFQYGHYGVTDPTTLINFSMFGSNKSQFADIKLIHTDGSSGALSLETTGSVLHISGAAAASGLVMSNSGSGFVSSTVGITGFTIYYPEQDWANWSLSGNTDIDGDAYYEPTVFPATFIPTNPQRVFFDKLCFVNSYHWINIKNVQLAAIGRVAGQLINRGYDVTRMTAGGVTESFSSYPIWTWACDFAGNSQRVNHYCDYKSKAIQVGDDNGSTDTVEQMRIIHADIIGAADGIICGGKGVSIIDAKIDNVMRGITVSDLDNSAYHQIGKAWISSYYRNNYTPKQRTDGSVYAFKSNTATPIDLSGLTVVRADGYGVWLPYASGTQVHGVEVQQCMYKAYVFGSRGRTTDVISVNGCYAGMYVDTTLTGQVAYEFGDFMRCDIKGLQWKGASNVTPYVLNNDLNYYEEGKELDLTTLGGPFYKGYSNSQFSNERGLLGQIVSLSSDSTTPILSRRLTGTNTGGVSANVGYGVRNRDVAGSGYGALTLYASVGGVATPMAEVFSTGSSRGLMPYPGVTASLGLAGTPWDTLYATNAVLTGTVTINGNPVSYKVAVPASATATGSVGQWAADSSYLYVCIAANTWVRAALATW